MRKAFKNISLLSLLLGILLFMGIVPTPLAHAQYGRQVKQGHVIARTLVRGEEGHPIFAEFDEKGNVVRVIGEATAANGLDGAFVMSGQAYSAYGEAYRSFLAEQGEGPAKGAYLLSVEDYEKITFKTLPSTNQPEPFEVAKPPLFQSTLTVLLRSNETLFHKDMNPVLLQSPINLMNLDQEVSPDTGAVLLDKNGNVKDRALVNIGYRTAYFGKEGADIQDASRDNSKVYQPGDTRLAPVVGALVSSSLSVRRTVTDENGRFFLYYQTPPCPGFSYDIETMVMAEMTYRNFNPKARTPWSSFYVTSPSLDSCMGYGYGTISTTLAGQMAQISARALSDSVDSGIRHHEIKVDIIIFGGEASLTNAGMGPPVGGETTSYDPGEDPEAEGDWPDGALDPAYRLVQGSPWDVDGDKLHDLVVASEQKGIVHFFGRGKEPVHNEPSFYRQMEIEPLENPMAEKVLSPADFERTDIFVYDTSSGPARSIARQVRGLDPDAYDGEAGKYRVELSPQGAVGLSVGDRVEVVLTYRDGSAAYLGQTEGIVTEQGVEVQIAALSLQAPRYRIKEEGPGQVRHRGLLKSISPEDIKDTDVYIFSESTGKLVTERIGLMFADESSDGNTLYYRVRALGPPTANFRHISGFEASTHPDWTRYQREVSQLRPGGRVKVVMINRATGYMGTATAEVKGRGGEGAGIDLAVDPIELLPPNLRIWAERTTRVEAGLTREEGQTNIISFEGSGLTSDTMVVVKSRWLDQDGTLLPEDLPGYTARLAKVVSPDVLGAAGGDSALFEIKPGLQTQLISLPREEIDNEHFYIHVSGQPGSRNPSFASRSGLGDTQLAFRPERYVPFQVPVFNEAATRLNAIAQAGVKSEAWVPGTPAPVLEEIEKVYDWPYRPELQFSLFELKVENVELVTEFDVALDRSTTTLGFDYNLFSNPALDPLERFGDERQFLFGLGYGEILALIGEGHEGEFPSVEELTGMMPGAGLMVLADALSLLQPEDYLSLQLYQADDVGNPLYELSGFPLLTADTRPFAMKRFHYLSQFDSRTLGQISSIVDDYRAFAFNIILPSKVSVKILDADKNEIATIVPETALSPGPFNFLLNYDRVEKAGIKPEVSPNFYVELTAEASDGSRTQRVRHRGKLIEGTAGAMLGQTMVHDVLIQDGSLQLSRQDVALKGRGPQLAFTRSYNNQATHTQGENQPLGPGWTHSLDKKLRPLCAKGQVGGSCLPDWVHEMKGRFFRPSQVPEDPEEWVVVSVNGTTFRKHEGAWHPERGRHGALEEFPEA